MYEVEEVFPWKKTHSGDVNILLVIEKFRNSTQIIFSPALNFWQ